MTDRLIFTAALNHPRYGEMAMGLGRSLKLIGDTTPRAIVTNIADVDWYECFDYVFPPPPDLHSAFWSKFTAFDLIDAKRALFVDADCLVFKRLGPVFDAFDGSCVGVQGHWANTGEWYGCDLPEFCQRHQLKAIPKFNGGVIYYENGPEFEKVIETSKQVADQFDSYGFGRVKSAHTKGSVPEEPCLSLAMAQTGLGTVIDEEANFHNSAVGLVGKLNLDVRTNNCSFLCRRYELQRVEPYIFHAHFYSKFTIYWKQLKVLENLSKYEKDHGFGYMSPTHKLSRSIQKRILRLTGKL